MVSNGLTTKPRNRLSGGRLILNPDQPVVNWSGAERATGQAWGMKTVPTFHTHNTPYVENQEQIDCDALAGIRHS